MEERKSPGAWVVLGEQKGKGREALLQDGPDEEKRGKEGRLAERV